jgi:vacuolar-type H+-ATPase subunit F/Vma7
MPEQRLMHVIGDEDIVLMFGLLGLKGTIVGNNDSFREKFDDLIQDDSNGMILIGLPLSPEDYNFLLEYKLHNKKPFIFILPDVFQSDFERKDRIKNNIFESIGDIIS